MWKKNASLRLLPKFLLVFENRELASIPTEEKEKILSAQTFFSKRPSQLILVLMEVPAISVAWRTVPF